MQQAKLLALLLVTKNRTNSNDCVGTDAFTGFLNCRCTGPWHLPCGMRKGGAPDRPTPASPAVRHEGEPKAEGIGDTVNRNTGRLLLHGRSPWVSAVFGSKMAMGPSWVCVV